MHLTFSQKRKTKNTHREGRREGEREKYAKRLFSSFSSIAESESYASIGTAWQPRLSSPSETAPNNSTNNNNNNNTRFPGTHNLAISQFSIKYLSNFRKQNLSFHLCFDFLQHWYNFHIQDLHMFIWGIQKHPLWFWITFNAIVIEIQASFQLCFSMNRYRFSCFVTQLVISNMFQLVFLTMIHCFTWCVAF